MATKQNDETPSVQPYTNTASVSRKIADGNYGSKEITIFCQFPGSATENLAEFEANADAAINACTAIELKHLGIEWEQSPTAVVVEKVFSGHLAQGPQKAETPKSFGGGSKPAAKPQSPKPQFPSGDGVTLGTSPVTGEEVVVKDGQYGAYITDGRKFAGKGVNASLPKGMAKDSLTLERALELLDERVEFMKNKAA